MFSFNKYCDIYMLLGDCLGNATKTVHQYALRYPNRQHPQRNVLERLHRRMRNSGGVWNFLDENLADQELQGPPSPKKLPLNNYKNDLKQACVKSAENRGYGKV
ncbi:hypothetical protein Zmor_011110 [Zophobas morio]|uniref:DUF4817 domain-containing protein n=1 Tax=Zophobas morio TaxID=2755281 RepID=A0AA38MK59_9CUCU|nr:hypothetical protein Zmor_011110 [Zophobas morio]